MSNKILIKIFSISGIITFTFATTIDIVKDFNKYPIPKEVTSISRGGDIPDKVAVEDGIGTIVIGGIATNTNEINNKAYNTLLKENINKLDNGGTTNLKDLSLPTNLVDNANYNKLVNENLFNENSHSDGDSCDDGNPDTFGETWLNNVCQGGTLQTYTNCNSILLAGKSTGDGTYTIDPDGAGGISPFDVYCDMTTDGGGWTKIGININSNPSSIEYTSGNSIPNGSLILSEMKYRKIAEISGNYRFMFEDTGNRNTKLITNPKDYILNNPQLCGGSQSYSDFYTFPWIHLESTGCEIGGIDYSITMHRYVYFYNFDGNLFDNIKSNWTN